MQIGSGQSVQGVNSTINNGLQLQNKPVEEPEHKEQNNNNPSRPPSGIHNAFGALAEAATSVVTGVVSDFTNGLKAAANCLQGYVVKMVNVFVPVQELVAMSKEKITKQAFTHQYDNLANVLLSEDFSKGITGSDKKLLTALKDRIHALSERQDISEEKFRELISSWASNSGTKRLFGLANFSKDTGVCITPEFREELGIKPGETLESVARMSFRASLSELENLMSALGEAREEVLAQPQGPEQRAALETIDQEKEDLKEIKETMEKAGGNPDNLTTEQKKRLKELRERVEKNNKKLTEDPQLSKCIKKTRGLLISAFNAFTSAFDYWMQYMEDEEKKLKCEEIEDKKKQIEKLCKKHKLKKEEAENLYIIMMRAKEKMERLLLLRKECEAKLIDYEEKYKYLKDEIQKHSGIYDFYRKNFELGRIAEKYYKNKERIEEIFLPSAEGCIQEVSHNLNLIS